MIKLALQKIIDGELPLDFNWNSDQHIAAPLPHVIPADPSASQMKKIVLVGEDLRDGLHGITEYPALPIMMGYVQMMSELGIHNITVGIYTGEKNKINETILSLLTQIYEKYPHMVPIILTLASEPAIAWAGECKKYNPNVNAIVFMGTAPSRLLVEEWQKEYILDRLKWAVHEATYTHHIDVIGATEHTTQTPPDFLRDIIITVVKNGAKFFCIADTIGIARPIGVARIIRFTQKVLKDIGATHVMIDWHGHDDLGNGVANAMTAIAMGVNRVHTVARGIGERAGNTRMEAILLNGAEILKEQEQEIPWNLQNIHKVLSKYDELTKNPTPTHGPLGKRAFSTSLGIHTSAMLKAELLARSAKEQNLGKISRKLEVMARKIYTALDPTELGRNHEIRVGPWSGKSTVYLAYLALGNDPKTLSEKDIEQILFTAKRLGRELTNEELKKLLNNNK